MVEFASNHFIAFAGVLFQLVHPKNTLSDFWVSWWLNGSFAFRETKMDWVSKDTR